MAVVICGFTLLSAIAQASPWVRAPGGIYAKVGVARFEGESSRATSASLYAELGLPAALGLTVQLPWVQSVAEDARFSYRNRDLGDLELSLSRALRQGDWALSASVGARLPLYPDRQDAREQTWGSLAGAFPSPGDGTVDLDGRLELGRGLAAGAWGGWVQGSAGYRHRLGAPTDGLTLGLRGGLVPRAGERDLGWLGAELQGVARFEDDPATRSWLRLGSFAAVRLRSGLAFELGGGWIPRARVASTGWDVGAGLSVQR